MPLQWFAAKPWEAWETQLATGMSADDRYQAFLALTQLGTPEQIAQLTASLFHDAAPELRAAALRWWQRLTLEEAASVLESSEPAVTAAALAALADDDPDVRLEAVATLARWQPQHRLRLAVLDELLHRDDLEPMTMARLARLCTPLVTPSDRIVPVLQRWLSDDHAEVREAAVMTLATFGPAAASALSELLSALDDEEPLVREHAARALGNIGQGTAEVIGQLAAATQDEDPECAAAASTALRRLQSP